MRAVDKINRNKMAAAVGKVWIEQKHILIQAKFSRINGNNRYISQSTRNWKFGQHKSGLTKPLKAVRDDVIVRPKVFLGHVECCLFSV